MKYNENDNIFNTNGRSNIHHTLARKWRGISIYNRDNRNSFFRRFLAFLRIYWKARVTFLGMNPMLSRIRFYFLRNRIHRRKKNLSPATYVFKSANYSVRYVAGASFTMKHDSVRADDATLRHKILPFRTKRRRLRGRPISRGCCSWGWQGGSSPVFVRQTDALAPRTFNRPYFSHYRLRKA